MKFVIATEEDGNTLAEIRAAAMRPSLEAVGRFDENRIRNRFLESFVPSETVKLVDDGELLGFYVIRDRGEYVYLDHLYIDPKHQNRGLGRAVVKLIVKEAHKLGLPVRLGALRGSRSNDFYIKNGFIKTHEDEFDLYYECQVTKP